MPLHFTRLSRQAFALGALALASAAAQAALITFDEQPWHTDPYADVGWSAYPITTEYDAFDVRIFSGYLEPGSYGGGPGSGQFLLGGPSFGIGFTGATLPTYVSLDFGMPYAPSRSTVSASGPGYGKTFSSGGTYWGGPDIGMVESPYTLVNHASFYSPGGISSLSLDTFTSTRIIASIDNLYFGNVARVPEPASLALLAAGLCVIAAARRRRRR